MEVENFEDVIQSVPEFEDLGYLSKGEFGIPGRQFFTQDTDGERTHHLHVFQQGHPDIERHTSFQGLFTSQPRCSPRIRKTQGKTSQTISQNKAATILPPNLILSFPWMKLPATGWSRIAMANNCDDPED